MQTGVSLAWHSIPHLNTLFMSKINAIYVADGRIKKETKTRPSWTQANWPVLLIGALSVRVIQFPIIRRMPRSLRQP